LEFIALSRQGYKRRALDRVRRPCENQILGLLAPADGTAAACPQLVKADISTLSKGSLFM
jgi:hypothetical protein